MNGPLVSIIIPVHNAALYLEQAVASAIRQSWQNKEIIIVDDGSTDDSLVISGSFACNGVKIIRQENKGASSARNKGLAEARGEYIQFLDADDLLSADKIEKQVSALAGHPGKLAVCSTVHFPEHKNHLAYAASPYEDSFLQDAEPVSFLINLYGGTPAGGSMIQPNAWLVPRSVIDKAGPWNEKITVDDDGEFFCRAVLASQGVLYAKNCFNYYRKFDRSASLSSLKSRESFESRLLAANLKYKYLKKATLRPEIDQVFAKTFLEIGILAYPAHPDLSKKAIALSGNILPHVLLPVIGGQKIEFFKKMLGWKAARRLQFFLKKYRKS
jgi:glycosyltransferase involved in cell wall biosynthesis